MLFILIFLSLFSFNSFSSENFSDHEAYCLNNKEKSCLKLLNKRIYLEKQYSKFWFKLMTYKLDYYYDNQKFEKIIELSPELINIKNKPEVFEVQLNFYYSKALSYFGKTEQAKYFANKTIQNLENIYNLFEEPIRMVEIANMEYVFGDKERAYKLLLLAENKFGEQVEPIFHFELNTNKGHILSQWKSYERASLMYQKALSAVRYTKHNKKKIIAYYNFARSNQYIEKNNIAIEYYKQAEMLLYKNSNPRMLALTLYRIAQIYKLENDLDNLAEYLKKVNVKYLYEGYHSDYHQLSKLVTHKR